MELLDLATGAFGVAGGGVFGLLGSVGSAWFKGKAQEKDRKHQLDLLDRQQSFAVDDHEMNLAESRQTMSSTGLVASIQADAAITSLPQWAAAIKALYRPFLTTALLCSCIYIIWLLMGALEGDNAIAQVFPRDEIIAMIRYAVYSVVFSAATSTTWWFGDRALSPPALK